MTYAVADDGVKLYYEEAGTGTPIIFVHEFGGDYLSWEPQMRHFSRRYRCISFSARGYLPSDVPHDVEMYSQERAVSDIVSVMDHVGVNKAHIVGLSMGGFATLHFGLDHGRRALSLVVAGAGYGAEKEFADYFRKVSLDVADNFELQGSELFAKTYSLAASRVQFQNKDPRGWHAFAQRLGLHSAAGSANTMRGVQARRPSIYDLADRLRGMNVPTLVVVGDEDDHCINPGVFMKRTIPACGLVILPKTGHTINLEEPGYFNAFVDDFLSSVNLGKWAPRDPRAIASEIMKTS